VSESSPFSKSLSRTRCGRDTGGLVIPMKKCHLRENGDGNPLFVGTRCPCPCYCDPATAGEAISLSYSIFNIPYQIFSIGVLWTIVNIKSLHFLFSFFFIYRLTNLNYICTLFLYNKNRKYTCQFKLHIQKPGQIWQNF
jgi:hypothetical protein